MFRNVKTAAHAVPRPLWRRSPAAERPGGRKAAKPPSAPPPCHRGAVGGHGGDWETTGSTGITTRLRAPGSLLEKSLREAL